MKRVWDMAAKGVHITFLSIICIIFATDDAEAYIDFGSGSMLFQALLAGFFGLLFTLKMYFKRIKIFLASLLTTFRKNNRTNG